MRDVTLGDALGEEDLHRLAEELVRGVSERLLDLRVDICDLGGPIHRHDRVRRRLEHSAITERLGPT